MLKGQPVKLKYVADYIFRGDAPKYVESDGIKVISQGCVQSSGLDISKAKLHDKNDIERISGWLIKGDVLINSTGTGTLGRVSYVENDPNEPMFADGHVTIVRDSKERFCPKFLFYYLSILQEQITVYCSEGATNQIELSRPRFGSLLINLPTIEVQEFVAKFLENKITLLDTLILEKENLLKLLGEKRRAIISSAVTPGTNLKAKFKDSGISWLGEIPEHWETRRIAYLFSERDERSQPDLPLLVVSINTGVTLRKFSDDRIENVAADASSYKVARKGDISFNKMRMWQGAVGVSPTDGLVSPDYVVAEPIAPMEVEYFGLLFKTPMFSAETARHSHGIVWDRLRLYWDDFRDIRVPLPPVAEQTAIVEAVREQTVKHDALKEATERTLVLLRERRTALIAAAVAGMLEMR